MTIAPISCGKKPKNASRPACNDSIIRLLSLSFQVVRSRSVGSWSALTCSRSPQATYSPTDEREEQGEDARDGQDGAQTLLRGCLLGALLRPLRQRDARELVYEADSEKTAHDREHQWHHQRQQWHQES